MKLKIKVLMMGLALIAICVTRVIYLPVGKPLQSHHQTDQKGYYDYQGVIHFHTNYSGDASGSFEEIARVANDQNVDFMISTDHDTLQPLDDKKEGWYQNTIFLTGEEMSVDEGYLLALNVGHLIRFPGEKTDEIMADAFNQGGMLFIAHPNHPRWRWKLNKDDARISGQEVLDFADQWYTAGPAALVTALAYYPFNPAAGLIQLYQRPAETLRGWDARALHRQFVGIFAPDFHQAVRIGHHFKIPFPKAATILPVAHDHVLLKEGFSHQFAEDKKNLYDAIRRGHLYVSMDLLGEGTGFLFSARQGSQTVWMGDQMQAGVPTFFSVKLPPAAESQETWIRVLFNGEPIEASAEKYFDFQASKPGVYRIEVDTAIPTFWGSVKKVVWIYSNPIYLREETH